MIDVYDFFSGCGGASKGFEQCGFNIKLGIDVNHNAAQTFRANFPNAAFIEGDIRKVTFKETNSLIRKQKDHKMLFCGCAPCQPFSKQNRQKKNNDSRINLLLEFLRFIRYYLPDYIFVENVPGIQNFEMHSSPLETFLNSLKGLKYNCVHEVIMAASYGVPQPRRRLIILASRHGTPYFPPPTNGFGNLPPYSTVRDWINNLPPIDAGEVCPRDIDHCAAKLSDKNLQRIINTPEGGSRLDWPNNLELECHHNHNGHTDVYGRLSFDKMAATLTTRCISYSNGRYGHPVQNRAISLREAACLQTFPRDFHFFGNLSDKAKQVGNAVPPLLAQRIGIIFETL